MTNEITNTNDVTSMVAFDGAGTEGKKKLFNALNSAQSLSESGVTTLTFDGLLIRPSVRTDAITGETVECESVTFIADDGTAYFSTSAGIVSSAKNLVAALGGAFPEGESITVVFKSRDLGRGRTLKYFEWA